uniref:protein-serine/threonine phosphatase n=1 Tax=Amphiprion ocellaris TaxID=80972 RepID=A0AAQ5YLU1_AMPOC
MFVQAVGGDFLRKQKVKSPFLKQIKLLDNKIPLNIQMVHAGEQKCLISESFLTVKGAALFLPRGNGSSPSSASRFSQLRSKHAGDIQQHLQTMFTLLRPEDNIKLAVRLESAHPQVTRYMVVVSTNGRQDTEESVVLGMDFSPVDSSCSVGLVLPLWSDTLIHLDGDGGFSVSTDTRVHVFKPVSVQAMWSALQSLHKACEVARCHNYFPGSLFLTWVSYYQSRVSSDQARINEWNAMQDVQSHRADSPVLFSDVPTERELTERQIKSSLREIMMQKDLENVTCKEIRTELEMHMTCNLREFKEFIDNEMIVILGQMDSPTEIFDHVFLGSEWNASNLEELQKSGVQYILNVTREIDNFFPGVFEYHNIRVYDEEATDLLAYWNDTYKFISRAKKAGSKCLVHCKMGISRSAATVIAYAMKEYGWDLKKAFDYVKERRTVTKPNPSFMRQLEEYQGILLASKQRHNKLWRSHSDSDLSEHHEPLSKSYAQPHSLGRSDPHNQASSTSGPSVKELLESLGTSASAVKASHSTSQPDTDCDPQTCGSSLDGLAPHPSSNNDFISYPSAIPHDNVMLFGHSADHINFFSAREKFKGMSQDGKSHCAAGQQSPLVKSCGKEAPPQEETWETLCELGAFLQQVSMGGSGTARRADQAFGATQKRGSSIQKRVREMEARIRQAGLTPPSLMKRSASLAKLGCLELLANDLSEWELSRSTAAPPLAQPPVHTVSDESKKQRVHNCPSSASQQSEIIEISAKRLSEPEETSPGTNRSPQRGNVTNSAQDSLHSPAPTLMTARQQYGRTHPLRRLKKRTVSTLYHTM